MATKQDFKGFDSVFAPGLLGSPLSWNFQRLNYLLSRRVDLEQCSWHGHDVIADLALRKKILDICIYHYHWGVLLAGGHDYLEECMAHFHEQMDRSRIPPR